VIPYTLGHYLAQVKPGGVDETHAECLAAKSEVEQRIETLLNINGKKTIDDIHRELYKVMWEYCGMARNAQGLEKALGIIPGIREEFWKNVKVPGSGEELNQSLERAGRLADFLELGEPHLPRRSHQGGSCGGHFR